ncbi:MAG: flippase-like domain-containing protein [Cyclobacteriaceae bacterium]|nr:flippase-like domain-containing protein [Cyclobacteriaceae bacterium]
MSKGLRSALQYAGMLAITALLLWLSLRGLNVGEGENKAQYIWRAWQGSDKTYLLAMLLVAYISHFLRAERWRMLLEATGNKVKLSTSFYSVMIGYMVNLAIPRGGEISRCYNLLKLEKTPVEVSFGTVVVERIVDVLCLLAVIAIAFLVEWDKLMMFISSLGIGSGESTAIPWWMYAGGVLGILFLLSLYQFRKNPALLKILRGFKTGLLSVFEMQHKWLFIFYSVAIWFLYFMMSYTVIMAFETTADLGFGAVLTLFALGAIAMAAPLPGGTGSYHTIVPLGLVVLYALPQADAIAFVFIFHAWQTLSMIMGGVVSLIISYTLVRWKTPPTK